MSDYRGDVRATEREYYWTLPRAVAAIFAGLVAITVMGWVWSVLSAPGRIISKTLDADNVISSYEWYRDALGNFKARTVQVRQFKALSLDNTVDANERNRVRIELAAIQQSCRDLAQRYNANANKINKKIFMGTSVPSELNAGECE